MIPNHVISSLSEEELQILLYACNDVYKPTVEIDSLRLRYLRPEFVSEIINWIDQNIKEEYKQIATSLRQKFVG